MRALVKNEPKAGLDLAEIEKPSPRNDELLISTRSVAVCGTDVHLYRWDSAASNFAVSLPIVLGHECSGEIIEVGAEVKKFKVGDRITLETHIPCGECYQCEVGNGHICTAMKLVGLNYPGAFADCMVVPERVAYRLPDGVSFEEGSLFEPAGAAMHGIDEASISSGDVIAIVGCGPVGLFALQMAHARGAALVAAIDIDDYRLKIAKKLGAVVINPLREDVARAIVDLSGRKAGVDAALEVSGAVEVYRYLPEIIRGEGRLITIGHPPEAVALDISKSINQRGLSVKGIFGRKIWETWDHLSALVEKKAIDLKLMISHRYDLEQYESAFKNAGAQSAKILLIP